MAGDGDFLVSKLGDMQHYPMHSLEAYGLTKYEGEWLAAVDEPSTIDRYNLDFDYLGSVTLPSSITNPEGLTSGTFITDDFGPVSILIIAEPNRLAFQTGLGGFTFYSSLPSTNSSTTGVATDGEYIYTVDSVQNQIFRYSVVFSGNPAASVDTANLGTPTRWDLPFTFPRGLAIAGNILFVLYSRFVMAHNKSTGAVIGRVFTQPIRLTPLSGVFDAFGLYVTLNPYGGGLGIKPTAEESRDLTKKATANQKLAIKPEAEHLRIRTFKRIVTQKLAIKPEADRDAITTHRGVEQKVGIKPTGEHLRIRTRKRIVNEKLGIKPDATESHSTNIRRSVTQKVGIKPESGGLLFSRARGIIQKLGIKPRASKSTHEEVTQKLGIKPTATSRSIRIVIISVIQKLGIKPDADHLRIRTIKRRVTQRLAIKPDGKAARNFKDEVTQKLGIKPEAIEGKDISRTITQKVGVKDGYSTRFKRFRRVIQKVGIKPDARGKVSKSPITIQTKVGIKPDAKKDRKVKRTAPQKLRIAGSVSMLTRYARVVTQRLQFGVHAAPLGLPSKAPFFNVKNRIRRVFRV